MKFSIMHFIDLMHSLSLNTYKNVFVSLQMQPALHGESYTSVHLKFMKQALGEFHHNFI